MKPTFLLLGVAGIATAVLIDAAPSKAILFIDFIPLSPTRTRIKASGTLTPSSLGASTPVTSQTGLAAGQTSRLDKGNNTLSFTYSSPAVTGIAGKRYAISGIDPLAGAGVQVWTGATPVNNPPLIMRFGSTKDIWLPNTYTGGAIDGSFDVDYSLAQIFGPSAPSTFAFTSGSEQIILRNDPAQAPGPVPLLGAAAAFGSSRKLRNRIQKSTPSRTA
jgi:hypothetical protein